MRKPHRIQYPKKIGFVHCVGSRDEKAGNRQCSKVCCATAVKQACEIKEKFPNSTVYCFYMDLRMFGRNYEDMYLEAQKKYGIIFVRGRVSEVSEKQDGTLLIKAEDTLSGKPLRVSLDLLVLMAGMQSSLTISNSCSSRFTLQVMSIVSLLIPFVLAYIFYAWRQMDKKKITEDEIAQSEHKY